MVFIGSNAGGKGKRVFLFSSITSVVPYQRRNEYEKDASFNHKLMYSVLYWVVSIDWMRYVASKSRKDGNGSKWL